MPSMPEAGHRIQGGLGFGVRQRPYRTSRRQGARTYDVTPLASDQAPVADNGRLELSLPPAQRAARGCSRALRRYFFDGMSGLRSPPGLHNRGGRDAYGDVASTATPIMQSDRASVNGERTVSGTTSGMTDHFHTQSVRQVLDEDRS